MVPRWLILIILNGSTVVASSQWPTTTGASHGSPDVTQSPVGFQQRSSSSPRQIPDLILLYDMISFQHYVKVSCLAGQQDLQLELKRVPYYSTTPNIYTTPKFVYWSDNDEARGLECYPTYDRDHSVWAPFTGIQAQFVPGRTSVTVDKDEDLRLTFTIKGYGKRVLWQKQPISFNHWREATLAGYNDQLIIPSHDLSGTGLYSVAPYTGAPSPNVEAYDMGTFSLLVRRCPADRYGADCREWCPDCMYGGKCDDVSGQCVCPPPLSGHRCQTRCPGSKIGQNCSIDLGNGMGKRVCLPAPLGCQCAPGYMGPRCSTGCGLNKWGAGCTQTCAHCQEFCDAVDGTCDNGELVPCAGGELGLPRLREPPWITNNEGDSVSVNFYDWDARSDDGELQSGETILGYRLVLLTQDGRNLIGREMVLPPSVVLLNLQPNTTYLVRVLVVVKQPLGDVLCVATGSRYEGRGERVHTTSFTTASSTKPSRPRDLRMVNVTDTEVVLEWVEPATIHLPITNYTVTVFSAVNQTTSTHSTTHTNIRLTGLKAGQRYQAEVAACDGKLRCSNAAELPFSTRPAPPKLLTGLEWKAASSFTITILLPTSATFPVWQWILVAEAQAGLTRAMARNIVVAEAQAGLTRAMARNIVNPEDPQNSKARAPVWVAARLLQDGSNVTTEFVVGDNKTYGHFSNRPLEQDMKYKLIVVTETRAGDYNNLYVSEPKIFSASPPAPSGGVLEVLLTLLFLCIVVVLLIAAFVWWRRSHRKPGVTPVSSDTELHAYVGINGNNITPDGSNHIETAVIPLTPVELEEFPYPEQDNQENVPPVAGEESVYANVSRRVPKEEVETFLTRAIHSHDTEADFKSVPASMPKSCSDGERDENRKKNRYKNILPYNDTRVKLALLPNLPFSDYINANYIQGHSTPDAFIASQGPKDFSDDTIGDFWRMVWESHCHIIVMLANTIENGRVKVAKYWPDEEPLVQDGLTVTLVSTKVKMDFIIRELQVSKERKVRRVQQYHYLAWPDHSVPQNPFGLAQMLNILMEGHKMGPITVHCSAGIGRTGSVILVLFLLQQLNTSGYVDTLEALYTLRNGRSRLVENTIQYIFSHKLLLEILTEKQTSYLCRDFPQELERLRLPQPHSEDSTIHQQFKNLKNLPKDLTYKFAQDPVCAKFNRNPNVLPADNRMVFLQSFGGGLERQYINMVRVNGMDRKDAYLAGEHPQWHTLGSVWRLVYERRLPVWVLLNSFPENHQEYPEVINNEQPQIMGDVSLTVTYQVSFKNFVEYHVEVTVPRSRVSAPHKCVVLKMNGWPHTEPLPASPEPLLAVLDKAKSIAIRKGWMLFTCKDGVEGCGLAVAMQQVTDRIDLLQEVDIYRSVISVIYDRPQFITSVEQYDFLHTAALEYLETNEQYSNFV